LLSSKPCPERNRRSKKSFKLLHAARGRRRRRRESDILDLKLQILRGGKLKAKSKVQFEAWPAEGKEADTAGGKAKP